jgi:hypothetical protein
VDKNKYDTPKENLKKRSKLKTGQNETKSESATIKKLFNCQ